MGAAANAAATVPTNNNARSAIIWTIAHTVPNTLGTDAMMAAEAPPAAAAAAVVARFPSVVHSGCVQVMLAADGRLLLAITGRDAAGADVTFAESEVLVRPRDPPHCFVGPEGVLWLPHGPGKALSPCLRCRILASLPAFYARTAVAVAAGTPLRRLVVLGLGGGAMCVTLDDLAVFPPDAVREAVDVDPTMLAAAREFGCAGREFTCTRPDMWAPGAGATSNAPVQGQPPPSEDLHSPWRVCISDAAAFCAQQAVDAHGAYSAVIVDVCARGRQPAGMWATPTFAADVAAMLHASGPAAAIVNATTRAPPAQLAAMRDHMATAFGAVQELQQDDSVLFVGTHPRR